MLATIYLLDFLGFQFQIGQQFQPFNRRDPLPQFPDRWNAQLASHAQRYSSLGLAFEFPNSSSMVFCNPL